MMRQPHRRFLRVLVLSFAFVLVQVRSLWGQTSTPSSAADGGSTETPEHEDERPATEDSLSYGQEAVVEAEPPPAAPGERSLTDDSTQAMPGAEGDPVRASQALPGMVTTLASSPLIGMRGAPPGQVMYEYDGIPVPYVFHLARGASVLHPWLVGGVSVHPTGGPARHGPSTGGVLAAHREPLHEQWRGNVRARLTEAAAGLQAPLGSRVTAVAAGRISYTEPLVSLVAPSFSLEFWDYQGVAQVRIGESDTLELFAFGAGDRSGQKREDGSLDPLFDADFHRVGLKWNRRDARRHSSALVYVGQDQWYPEPLPASNRSLGLRFEQTHWLNDSHALDVGGNLLVREQTDVLDAASEYQRLDIDGAAWVSWEYRPSDDLVMTLGARVDLLTSDETVATEAAVDGAVSPRFAISYQATPSVRLHNAVGFGAQRPSPAQPAPARIRSVAGGAQRSLLADAGATFNLPAGLELDLTGFHSIVFNTADVGTLSGLPGQGDETRGQGGALGFEASLTRSLTRRLSGYLAYTLSRATRSVGLVQRAPAQFDRTHVLDAGAHYDLGRGWSATARFSFYTGFPARVASVADAQEPPRTSPYHQVDAQVAKRWKLDERGTSLSATVGILNATLQSDAEDLDCTTGTCRESMIGPATIPTLGIEGEF